MIESTPTVLGIDRVTITVPDLEAAQRFYGEALGFVPAGPVVQLSAVAARLLGAPEARIASQTLNLGVQQIELLAFDPPGRPYPEGSTSSDLWFQHCAIVVADMAAAYAHLQGFASVPISSDGPQTLPPSTGSVSAYKFRDPFGHPLELLHFPTATGDAAWHDPAAYGLFLGIDHTAIAVGDLGQSRRFYEGALGLRETGLSHNAGPEQTRLDAVAADRVEVVALSPRRQTPHLELLAYRTGLRRTLPTSAPADMALTRTILDVADLGPVLRQLHSRDGNVTQPIGSIDRYEAIAVADPDRHNLVLRHRPDQTSS